ncbi:glutamic acid-rich protein [Herrania umbratica]|uniref:Glutamic acid-rich protein n=1 Tax=Herrania umbratica TaxID=108875 RepID=A0A6J1AFL4_9ROSI|nr:glutamic acid-rich protein [Herrania umbratica]
MTINGQHKRYNYNCDTAKNVNGVGVKRTPRRKDRERVEKMSNRRKSSATAESDEVEQLLQAAQDETLLKLSVDSHMSRVAPDYLDPNLHRRFQALRSRPSTSQSKSQLQKQSPAPLKQQQQQQKEEVKKEQKSKVVVVGNVDEELRGVLGDDLSARFAALKASLSSSSDPAPAAATKEVSIGLDKSDGEDEEDEVENVIRWAMDAARLDPSPPSDDDDDHIDSDVDDNVDDDDDDDYPKNKKKESKSSRKRQS